MKKSISANSVLLWVILVLVAWLVINSVYVNMQLATMNHTAGSAAVAAAGANAPAASSTKVYSAGPYVTGSTTGFKVGTINPNGWKCTFGHGAIIRCSYKY